MSPSGKISVQATRLGSGANFSRQFSFNKRKITLEDVFSLIHQNILSAVATTNQLLFKEGLESLPDPLYPLFQSFDKKKEQSSKSIQLLSIQQNHPLITLEYNLPMANHSAMFTIDYHQQTQQVTLHGKVFGIDWNHRMSQVSCAIDVDAVVFDVQVEKEANFSNTTSALDFIWTFPASRLPDISESLYECFSSYDEILNVGVWMNDNKDRFLLRHPHLLQALVTHDRLDLLSRLLKFTSRNQSVSQLSRLLHESPPDTIAAVLEYMASSSSSEATRQLFDTLSFLKMPRQKEYCPIMISIVKRMNNTSCEQFKLAIVHALPSEPSSIETLATIAKTHACHNVMALCCPFGEADLTGEPVSEMSTDKDSLPNSQANCLPSSFVIGLYATGSVLLIAGIFACALINPVVAAFLSLTLTATVVDVLATVGSVGVAAGVATIMSTWCGYFKPTDARRINEESADSILPLSPGSTDPRA